MAVWYDDLIALHPVQTIFKAKAFVLADRLIQNILLRRSFNSGNELSRKMISDWIFDMPRDRIVPLINFRGYCSTTILKRAKWVEGCLLDDGNSEPKLWREFSSRGNF